MLFFVLDFIIWCTWDLLCWCVQYLGPLVLLVQLVRLILADADLSLLTYEKFGQMPNCLRGKVVWITGASSGIGEHLAYVLARSGCKLVLSARRKQELERVKQACLEIPYIKDENILVLPMDVLETEKHPELLKIVTGHFGKVDILVNHAARVQLGMIKDTPLQMDRDVIELLVIAQIALTKAVLPHFIEQKAGHVVVTSSMFGKFALPGCAAYITGKFALHGFFEALRMEHVADNIDVSMICPGPVVSNIVQNAFTVEGKEIDGDLDEKTSVSAERCAVLMAVAMANRVGEAWIAKQPYLTFTYLGQYFPDCFKWLGKKGSPAIVKKILGKQKAAASVETKCPVD